jgi:hypothetical protein
MKRTFNIIIGLAALVLATVSCQKETAAVKAIDSVVVGEWHLMGAKAEGVSILTDMDIYLCINADSTFELYQKSGTQETRYDLYTGTCHTENGVLTGVYSDGQPWGGKYTYAKTIDGILLRTTNDIEEQKYISCQIPAEVRKDANLIRTKSASEAGSPIL